MVGAILAGAVVAGATTAVATLGKYAVMDPKATLLAPSIFRGPQDRPAIALTFDDGPSESTPRLLKVLEQYRIRATFFQCGENVTRLPEIAREVKVAGHELGNHSYSHPHFWFKSPGFIYSELARAQETIETATGVRPALFRSPFGIRWFGMRRAQRRLGLIGVMWTAIGYDWMCPAEKVVEILGPKAMNGGIFCLHDGRRTCANRDISPTIDAVASLAPMLLDRGFCFESVGEMMRRCNAPIEQSAIG